LIAEALAGDIAAQEELAELLAQEEARLAALEEERLIAEALAADIAAQEELAE
jgi:hypothetical protein